MRIQHNIAALNSHRQLTNNNSSVSKNLEKLSSGYRINRAGDDAAGLAISEKMRAQITGLDTASKNAQDGISLVQTAEGALTEVHSMLNRMSELAAQSANGTYQDSVDRENIQKELDSLRSEVNRISEGTNFNGIKLLDGNLSSTGKTSTSAVEVKLDMPGAMMGGTHDIAAKAGVFKSQVVATIATAAMKDGGSVSVTVDYTNEAGEAKSKTIELTFKADADPDKAGKLVAADGTEYSAAGDGTAVRNEIASSNLVNALNSELLRDADFKQNIGVALGGTNGTDRTLDFTAKTAGTGGAAVTGLKYNISGVADTSVAQSISTTTKATDAYQAVDFGALGKFDGTTNGESTIFELNGKKFAFVNDTVTDEQLKAAGITDYVKIANANANPLTADVTAMVEKIKFATGLDVEKGTLSGANNDVFTANAAGTAIAFRPSTATKAEGGGGLSLQIGESSDSFNQLTVSVASMSTKALGIDDINIGSQPGAKAAIDKIKAAINSVSSTRGDLGAIQNRLEHTINNLGVTSENMSAAESRIRDVDMAKEMMTFTKNNILTQASQAMLAQANQLPQGVLQLLQ